jgi:hypothetical protein
MQHPTRTPFEALCDGRYCWHLGCTTCGCWPLRHDLYRLILGFHPDDLDWRDEFRFVEKPTGKAPYREIVVKPERGKFPSRYPEYPPPRELSFSDQLKLQGMVQDVRIADLNMHEPRWLGYLGVVLKWCEEAERSNMILTASLIPQFAALLTSGGPNTAPNFDRILERHLSWQDLEDIERALLWGKIIKQPAPR